MATHIKISISSEDKSKWETRTPLMPEDLQQLMAHGLSIVVQDSSRRAFSNEEYQKADNPIINGFTTGKIILGNLKTMLFYGTPDLPYHLYVLK